MRRGVERSARACAPLSFAYSKHADACVLFGLTYDRRTCLQSKPQVLRRSEPPRPLPQHSRTPHPGESFQLSPRLPAPSAPRQRHRGNIPRFTATESAGGGGGGGVVHVCVHVRSFRRSLTSAAARGLSIRRPWRRFAAWLPVDSTLPLLTLRHRSSGEIRKVSPEGMNPSTRT